jgi:hypothetical protein
MRLCSVTKVVAGRASCNRVVAKTIVNGGALTTVTAAIGSYFGHADCAMEEIHVRGIFFGTWGLHKKQPQMVRKLVL